MTRRFADFIGRVGDGWCGVMPRHVGGWAAGDPLTAGDAREGSLRVRDLKFVLRADSVVIYTTNALESLKRPRALTSAPTRPMKSANVVVFLFGL